MNEDQLTVTEETAEAVREEEEAAGSSAEVQENELPAQERIRELEEELRRTRKQFALRERRLCCIGHLQKRGIREEVAELLVTEADADMPEEELLRRVHLLDTAVEEAAVRQLRARAADMSPRSGTETLLTGDLIRQTPVARLAEMMGK